MSNNAQIFQSSSARFVAQRGFGEDIVAKDLHSRLVAGRGLYIEVWRDFTWGHIDRVVNETDGKVTVVVLETQDTKEDSPKQPGVTSEITLTKVVERSVTFDADDVILISKEAVGRPKNRRHGKITTFVNEELAD